MDEGLIFALEYPWWVWQHKKTIAAVVKALLDHWWPLVEKKLQGLGIEQRAKVLEGLSSEFMLRRDRETIRRLSHGAHGLTEPVQLGLSIALKVSTKDLALAEDQWLAAAARKLCPAVAAGDALAYALYRIARPSQLAPKGDHDLDRTALLDVKRQGSFGGCKDAEDAVLRVARLLGPLLVEIDCELREDARGRKGGQG